MKFPAEYKVPVVPPLVLLLIMKAPAMVPAALMLNVVADVDMEFVAVVVNVAVGLVEFE